jgi:hypothetical protein
MFATRYQENLAEFQQIARLGGIEEGLRLSLKRMACHRFGPLPSWAETHIEEVSASDLDRLMDKLLGATTLEDWLLTKH